MRRRFVLALPLVAWITGCEHQGPNQIDGRFDGPPRDARPADAPFDDAPPPDAAPADTRPSDAAATDGGR